MNGLLAKLPFLLGTCLILVTACSRISAPGSPEPVPTRAVLSPTPVPQPSPVQTQVAGFGPVIFCEGVSEAGEPLRPSNHFKAGTHVVWAYFPFGDIQPGQPWGRSWEWEGEVFAEARQETWQGESSGWAAYAISGEAALQGSYSITLFLEGEPVQQASFEVESAQPQRRESSASVGNLLLAKDITTAHVPIGVTKVFEGGVPSIQAVFSFQNFKPGQGWGRAWLFNGETVVEKALVWNEEAEAGITSFTFTEEDGQLDPGSYRLDLTLDGAVVRSAEFEVTGGSQRKPFKEPASPEEIVAPDLLVSWDYLAQSGQEILLDLVDTAYKNRIRISLTERLDTKAAYQVGGEGCSQLNSQAGEILVGRKYYDEHAPQEAAVAIAQQLAYAVWHLETGGCSCSIEREYYAFMIQFYLLEELDRLDLLEDKLAGLMKEDGSIDGEKLWSSLEAAYPECPDYGTAG